MKTPRRIHTLMTGYWLLMTLFTLPAFAGTHTWTGGSTFGLWSTAANWEGNDAPAPGESPLHLVFPTNATRRFATNYNPAVGQSFLILRNNSGSPIAAPFFGLPEGAGFYVDDTHRMQITYHGGDGNDVVLTAIAGPAQMSGVTVNGNRAYINGTGTPGASYHVEATTTVANPASWVNLGTIMADGGGLLQYVDADYQNHPHRFFRFVVP